MPAAGSERRIDVVRPRRAGRADRELHRAAPDGTPALVAVDQEGGVVQRVRAPATQWPPMIGARGPAAARRRASSPSRSGARSATSCARSASTSTSRRCSTSTRTPRTRSSATARSARERRRRRAARARVRARARRGRRARVRQALPRPRRHRRPTRTSSCRASITRWARLEAVELVPFRAPPPRGMPMLMTAHVVFAALDPTRPATLSPQVVTGLLRGKLGYRGVDRQRRPRHACDRRPHGRRCRCGRRDPRRLRRVVAAAATSATRRAPRRRSSRKPSATAGFARASARRLHACAR